MSDQPQDHTKTNRMLVRSIVSGEGGKEFLDQLGKAVHEEGVKQFGVRFWSFGFGILGLAVLGGWLSLKPFLIDNIGGVPSGAVMAFDLDSLDDSHCPKGWVPFTKTRGRVLIGAGDSSKAPGDLAKDENGNPLKQYNLLDHGGSATHIITADEMPPHAKFTASTAVVGSSPLGPKYPAAPVTVSAPVTVGTEGAGKGYSTMPPYLAVYYCKKAE